MMLGTAVVGGCSIDTELGVAATIDQADVSVVGVGDDAMLSTSTGVTFRVGENALSSQSFVPTSLEVYLGGQLIAALVPAGSDGAFLAPGESRTVQLSGGPDVIGDADVLCGQVARVRLVYRFSDSSTVSTSPTFRDAEVDTADVRCE